jgi:hypothetical protein
MIRSRLQVIRNAAMNISSEDFSVGVEDFDELISNGMIYIDKTSFLRSLLKSGDAVSLLLRPRRFGKTLSMSMIESFLEINYQNPEDRSRQENLFKNLEVYKDQELCNRFMGRYPVISISLKEVEGSDFPDAMKSMLRLLRDLFDKYRFLLDSDKQPAEAKDSLRLKLKNCYNDELNLKDEINLDLAKSIAKDSLKFLGNMLFREYNQKVFFLVDEYDVPLQKATVNKYYDDMLNVICGMLGSALKTNSCMKKGFVTGCLRISHQSIFTGINHFATFGLDDMRYSRFIGLTKDETEQLLKNCGMEKRLDDVRTWYDGYNIAGNDMLCPWSVLNFLSNALAPDNDPSAFMPENYWINSSGNDIVDLCMKYPSSEHSEKLQKLINGETEEIHCREFTTYPDIFNAGKTATASFDTFATLMLHTGYLTCVKNAKATNGNTVIKIPNEEIRNCFKAKAEYIFSSDNPEWREKGCCLRDALFEGKPEEIQKIIDSMLMTFISFRDSSYESYYHGFMTGVLSMVKTAEMELKSNHESGNGFSDVIIQNENSKSAVILEFKRCENGDPATRYNVCCAALSQIDAKQYDYDLKQRGYTRIFKYGVAFYGKGCTVGMNGSENS